MKSHTLVASRHNKFRTKSLPWANDLRVEIESDMSTDTDDEVEANLAAGPAGPTRKIQARSARLNFRLNFHTPSRFLLRSDKLLLGV